MNYDNFIVLFMWKKCYTRYSNIVGDYMRFRKTKINKDSSRIVIHSISEALIKKNPNVEKEHIITKIK